MECLFCLIKADSCAQATIEYIAMLVADDDTGTEDKIETIEGILADTEVCYLSSWHELIR